ncbi:BON domain-containing protein [Paraburkholderia caffeinilytica]|uniref:BON domain-containing protein n=1 Tax=Paraburkholderia caffeinilytica TaxID=1761016 RepID=UPI0038B76302
MKSAKLFKALGGVVAVMVVCTPYAQANDTLASSVAANPGSSAKAARAADKQLARAVRAALASTRGIDVSGIAVRASGGAVVLKGSVPDAAQIDKAGDVAKGVTGVTSVTNKLVGAPHQGQGR